MRSYFANKINLKTQQEYVAGNINEADTVFSLSDDVLDEIAIEIIMDLHDYFFGALKKERGFSGYEAGGALRIYLRSVNRYRKIDDLETLCLVREVELGDFATGQAREQLICSYLGWAYRITRHFVLPGIDILDLIQAASEGLIDAVDKWRMENAVMKGSSFVTYSAYRVKGEILDCIRNGEGGSLVTLMPRSVQETRATIKILEPLFRFWKIGAPFPNISTLAKLTGASRVVVLEAIGSSAFLRDKLGAPKRASEDPLAHLFKDAPNPEDELQQAEASHKVRRIKQMVEWLFRAWEGNEPFPSADTLAELLGESKSTVLLALHGAVLYLDGPSGTGDDNHSLGDFIETKHHSHNPEKAVLTYMENRERIDMLEEKISELSARDSKLLRLLFGFTGEEPTYKSVGKTFGITESRVCQLVQKFFTELNPEGGAVLLEVEDGVPTHTMVMVVRLMARIVEDYEEAPICG